MSLVFPRSHLPLLAAADNHRSPPAITGGAALLLKSPEELTDHRIRIISQSARVLMAQLRAGGYTVIVGGRS
jgi:hypothetical protein